MYKLQESHGAQGDVARLPRILCRPKNQKELHESMALRTVKALDSALFDMSERWQTVANGPLPPTFMYTFIYMPAVLNVSHAGTPCSESGLRCVFLSVPKQQWSE